MELNATTIAFEIVNFVVLVIILERFVYRPVVAAIQTRRHALADGLARAAEEQASARKERAELEARSRDLDELRRAVLDEANADAVTVRNRILEEARATIRAERERGQISLSEERAAVEDALEDAIVDAACDVSMALVSELAPDAAHDTLVRHLVAALRAAPAVEGVLEVEVGRWDEDVEERLTTDLREALGDIDVSIRHVPEIGLGARAHRAGELFDGTLRSQVTALAQGTAGGAA